MTTHRILFLCTGNSARSQMAEVLLRLIAGDSVEAASAGTHPVGVNPMTIEVMKELGIEMTHQRSKHVQEFDGQEFDYVITVCDRAKETCPILPAASRLLHCNAGTSSGWCVMKLPTDSASSYWRKTF